MATKRELEPVTAACPKCGGSGMRSIEALCDGGCNGMGTVRLDLDVDWLRGRVVELEAENACLLETAGLMQLVIDSEPIAR